MSALAPRLDRFQRDSESLARLEVAAGHLASSFNQLQTRFDERRSQRDALAHRLEVIQTDKASLELMAGGLGELPSSDVLVRASTLAQQLEDELLIENEIAEQLDMRSVLPVDSDLFSEDLQSEDVTERYDRIMIASPSLLSSHSTH